MMGVEKPDISARGNPRMIRQRLPGIPVFCVPWLGIRASRTGAAKKNAKYAWPRIAKMLDLNDSESRERIRLQVESNIKRIMRGRRAKPTHYDVLQVSPQASADEIEVAYQKAFLRLREAHDVLSDGAKRNAYDEAIAPDQVAEPMDEKE